MSAITDLRDSFYRDTLGLSPSQIQAGQEVINAGQTIAASALSGNVPKNTQAVPNSIFTFDKSGMGIMSFKIGGVPVIPVLLGVAVIYLVVKKVK